jgi:predicted metal-dependent hydrolase
LVSDVVILGNEVKIVRHLRSRPAQIRDTLYVPLTFSNNELRLYLRKRLKRILKAEYRKLTKEKGFFIIGEVSFELIDRFRDKTMLAALKGSTIFVREDIIKLSRVDIREIVVHEVAHLFSKGHGERFQMAVQFIGGSQRRLPIQL